MTLLVVVQARMGSSRLPGKVALPLAGRPLLVYLLERLQWAATPFELCVATSTLPEDDAIVAMARAAGVRWHRGHPLDCLERHLTAAREVDAHHVAKIPSDCPLVDLEAVDAVLAHYLAVPDGYHYVSNLHPPSWPDGNDVEVMSREALERAAREAARPFEREHTTPYLWEHPERFRLGNVRWSTGLDLSMTHRFTIDYADDYRFLERVVAALHRSGERPFGAREVLAHLEAHPEVHALNARLAGVNWYRHHLHELRRVTPDMTRQDATWKQ